MLIGNQKIDTCNQIANVAIHATVIGIYYLSILWMNNGNIPRWMNLSLEKLTHILAKVWISSSLEKEILIAAKHLITPPETDGESTYEESKYE